MKGKYQLQIRKLNESLYANKAEIQLLPQTEKKLKMQLLELKTVWRNGAASNCLNWKIRRMRWLPIR